MQCFFSQKASFCRPPESVIINLEFFAKLENLYEKYHIPNLKTYKYTKKEMSIHAKNTSQALSGSFEGNPIRFDIKSAEEVLFNLV